MNAIRWTARVAFASLLALAGVALAGAPAGADTQSFTSNGTFVVPAGVSSLTIELVGGAGGSCDDDIGGFGATVQSTVAVNPGDSLDVTVGGQGGPAGAPTGGANGGGDGSTDGGGGGGATDVRPSGSTLTDRVLVAGGGGGCAVSSAGGDGGYPTGADSLGSEPATGGTQSAGGTAGNSFTPDGAFGTGGTGDTCCGGGGGGGWYGGGGGGEDSGGGGGSSYAASIASAVSHGVAATRGPGSVTITWSEDAPTTTTTAVPTMPTTNAVAGDGEAQGGSGELPATGRAVAVPVAAGVALTLIGGLIVRGARRRPTG